ncbi:MAG: acyl-CoA thioesterase [Candidatus Brocadiaceae bacterium]|nr:acyl-CoA thioesterase [Candidatus Brocadiaceae bacterium]
MNLTKTNTFSLELTVEFDEVDSYGIAHHSRLITYLERSRVHYFASKGFDLKNLPYGLVVYKIESRFIKPAHLLDKLSVETVISDITSSYVTIMQRILRENKTLLKAKIVKALMCMKTGEIVMVPEEFRQVLLS